MSQLKVLRLRGRHVRHLRPPLLSLLVVSTLLWLPVKSEDHSVGCHDADLNITRAAGEQWLLPNCGGLATCRGYFYSSSIYIAKCPETHCQRLDDGDPTATFPRCCPRLSCPFCYSEQLDRHFLPGNTWTESPCVQHRCVHGPSGTLQRHVDTCEPLGPPPSLDCELVEQDVTRGEYPLCCAHYRCLGLCRSGDTWRSVTAVREDSCDKPRDASTSWLP